MHAHLSACRSGLQNLCGVVAPRSVGSTPAPLRHAVSASPTGSRGMRRVRHPARMGGMPPRVARSRLARSRTVAGMWRPSSTWAMACAVSGLSLARALATARNLDGAVQAASTTGARALAGSSSASTRKASEGRPEWLSERIEQARHLLRFMEDFARPLSCMDSRRGGQKAASRRTPEVGGS